MDRCATLNTRISKEGQVLTDVRYFVKNRGNPNFRVTLPPGTQLWSALVNDAAVVPVTDAGANLIPLPQRADPNALITVDLKLAAPSTDAGIVTVAAPIVAAPVMLAEWKLEPDCRPSTRLSPRFAHARRRRAGHLGRLRRAGAIVQGRTEKSGHATGLLIMALIFSGAAIILWRWAARDGVHKFAPRHLSGSLFGVVAFALAIMALVHVGDLAAFENRVAANNATFLAPVQQAGSSLSIEVANLPLGTSTWSTLALAWPVLLALAICRIYGWRDGTNREFLKRLSGILGWTCMAWAALRMPNGAQNLFYVLILFLVWYVAIPALRRLWRMPRRSATT